MKHWPFLFSYLVAPKGAVCLFVCFSLKAMEFFFIIAFTEEFLPLVFWRSTSLFRFMNRVHHPLETRKLSMFICCAAFWRANGSDFLSGRAHSFCFPRPIRRPFSRAQATGTSCHDLHIWFSAETLCCQSSFSSLGLTFRRCQTSGWQQNCWSCQTQT